jgi:hypothetical protein
MCVCYYWSMFTWLGLIATIFVWAGLALLLTRWRDSKRTSISSHGASAPGAALLFKILLVGSSVLYYVWLVGWYVPHLQLHAVFTVLLTVAMVYQVVTGLVNGQSGLSKDIHDYTSQTMALLYIPLTALVLQSPRLSLVSLIICAVLFAYMLNTHLIVEVMKRLKSKHLFFQTAYIVAFQLFILVSAYLN